MNKKTPNYVLTKTSSISIWVIRGVAIFLYLIITFWAVRLKVNRRWFERIQGGFWVLFSLLFIEFVASRKYTVGRFFIIKKRL